MTKTMRALVWVLLCSMSAAIFSMVIYLSANRLEYKECLAYIPHQEVIENNIMTNTEIMAVIDKINNRTFKVQYVKDADFDGQVKFCAIFDNTIYLNQKLLSDMPAFAWAYAHETIHATKLCLDERKTQYLTFVLLYESGIDYLQQIALYQASSMINNIYREYDATYYIVEYLKQYKQTA